MRKPGHLKGCAPKALRAKINAALDYAESRTPIAGEDITTYETDKGIGIDYSGGSGSSGSSGVTQIVTGAVNGEPATLGVLADPNVNGGQWLAP